MGVLASDSIQLASLKTVKDAATEAVSQAGIATAAASTALAQLSTVEDVVGTLAWISEHGTYKETTDTEKAAGKYYFARSEQYALTEDTMIDPEKTYYTRSGSGTEQDPYVYTEVANPDVQDIGTYYELSYAYSPVVVPDDADPAALGLYELDSIDEAVSNYVASHLALTDVGLYVSSNANGWRVLIASDGVYIINTAGTIVAQYKDTVRIGEADKHHIDLSSSKLEFINEDSEVVGEMGTHAGTIAYDVNDEVVFTGNPTSDGTTYTETDLMLAHTPPLLSESGQTNNAIRITINLINLIAQTKRAITYVDLYEPDIDYTITPSVYFLDMFEQNFKFEYVSADDVLRMKPYPSTGSINSMGDTCAFDFTVDYKYTGTAADAPYYTFGTRQVGDNIGAYSLVAGINNEASGVSSLAEGENNEATNDCAHAEGYGTLASGVSSHAEGKNTQATGEGTHAEGIGTLASGTLGNRAAHAEGINTKALGEASHAGGIGTVAGGAATTALGRYNTAEHSNDLFVIGCGAQSSEADAVFVEDSGKLVSNKGFAIKSAPKDTSPDYFLTLHESFANGGTVGWIAKADMSSAIGMGTAAEHNGSSTSVPNATDTTLCNSGSLSAGTYLLQCVAQFAASSSGRRVLFLTTSSTGSNINRYTQIIGAPSPSNYTQMSFTYPVTITATTTFYLRAYQNSGGAINVTGGIRVLKIH